MNIDSRRIRQARIDCGLNVNDVVEKTGVSRISIYRLENGLCKNPQAKTIKPIACLYGKDASYFYEEVVK